MVNSIDYFIIELCKLLEDYNYQSNIKVIELLTKLVLFSKNQMSPHSLNKIVGTFFIFYFKAFTIKNDEKFAIYIDYCLKMVISDLCEKVELFGEVFPQE